MKLIILSLTLLLTSCASQPTPTRRSVRPPVGNLKINCRPNSFKDLIFYVKGKVYRTPWPEACELLADWLANDDDESEEATK